MLGGIARVLSPQHIFDPQNTAPREPTETLHAYRLDSAEVPLPPLPHAMVWCGGRSRDPALSWLRDRLRPIVKRNFAS
jgi:DNA-binding transcriptional LysR family regulator